MKKMFLILFLVSTPVFADCVSIDTAGWSKDRKNAIPSTARLVMFQAGHVVVRPTFDGSQLCFADFSGASSVVNQGTLLAALVAGEQDTEASNQSEKDALKDLKKAVADDALLWETYDESQREQAAKNLIDYTKNRDKLS